jgi:hypothetical protein
MSTSKVKDLAMVLAIVLSSITSIKFKYDKDGIEVELHRTQQQLAEVEQKANDFALAGVCD